MKRSAFASETKLEPVSFVPITEVAADKFLWINHAIQKRRQLGRRSSFGAFIFRQLNPSHIEELKDLLGQEEDAELHPPIEFTQNDGSALHIDPDPVNSQLLHVTEVGTAEAIILLGTQRSKELPYHVDYQTNRNIERSLASHLFLENMLDRHYYTTPATALRSVVHEGDAILFDASQPHAFLSVTEERVSKTYFASYPN